MAIFYWKGGVDTAWATVANWFKDEALSVAAGTFPSGSTDIAVIPASGSSASIVTLGANRTIAAFIDLSGGTYRFSALDYTLTVGSASFVGAGSGNEGTIAGDCVFSGVGSYNFGYITGNCVFKGSSSYNALSITGACVFIGDYSQNNGTITGNALFQTGIGMSNPGTITSSLLALVPISSTGTAGKYPLDVLNTGI